MKKFLLNNEIMVFCGDFSLSEKFSLKMLDESDKARLNDNPNLANSLRFLASRALKFYALNEFLSKNSKNKTQKLNFCLSHSANCVALAVANFKIGFDIEPLKPRNIEPAMDFCFNDYEKKRVLNATNKGVNFGENLNENVNLERNSSLNENVNLEKNLNLNKNAILEKNVNLSENASLMEFYRIFTAKEALLKLFDLTFSDFDKVGFNETNFNKKGKIRIDYIDYKNLQNPSNSKAKNSLKNKAILKAQNPTLKHHKFSFNKQEFLACCAF